MPQAGAKKQRCTRVSGDGVGVISQGPYDACAEPRARSGLEAGRPRDGSALRAADPHNATHTHKAQAREAEAKSVVMKNTCVQMLPAPGRARNTKGRQRQGPVNMHYLCTPAGRPGTAE